MHVVFVPQVEGWYTPLTDYFVPGTLDELERNGKWYAEVRSGFERDQVRQAIRLHARASSIVFSEQVDEVASRTRGSNYEV